MGRVERLFRFYDAQLTDRQRSLLGVLSLFRAPVSAVTIDRLTKHLVSDPENPDADTLEESVQGLQTLSNLCLVIRQSKGKDDDGAYVCHPALRDGVASSFRLNFAWSEPMRAVVEDRREGDEQEVQQTIRLMHAVISCLLDAGEYARADEIVRNHLQDGWLFVNAREVHDGALCIWGFVRGEERQPACEQLLSEARLVHYLRMAGLLFLHTGNIKDAAPLHAAVARRANSSEATRALLNQSLIYSITGELELAESLARTTLQLTEQHGDWTTPGRMTITRR